MRTIPDINVIELRLFNWIKPKFADIDYQVIPEDFVKIAENPQDYQPIPLTEEWLLKFGFEKDGKRWIASGWYLLGSRFRLRVRGASFENILYVHQLQNAYFCLEGLELQIRTHEPV